MEALGAVGGVSPVPPEEEEFPELPEEIRILGVTISDRSSSTAGRRRSSLPNASRASRSRPTSPASTMPRGMLPASRSRSLGPASASAATVVSQEEEEERIASVYSSYYRPWGGTLLLPTEAYTENLGLQRVRSTICAACALPVSPHSEDPSHCHCISESEVDRKKKFVNYFEVPDERDPDTNALTLRVRSQLCLEIIEPHFCDPLFSVRFSTKHYSFDHQWCCVHRSLNSFYKLGKLLQKQHARLWVPSLPCWPLVFLLPKSWQIFCIGNWLSWLLTNRIFLSHRALHLFLETNWSMERIIRAIEGNSEDSTEDAEEAEEEVTDSARPGPCGAQTEGGQLPRRRTLSEFLTGTPARQNPPPIRVESPPFNVY